MFIESLGRHLTITSLDGISKMCATDKDFWNIIILLAPNTSTPEIHFARRQLRLIFDDAENTPKAGEWLLATEKDLTEAFAFVDDTTPEPIAIHCLAGLSRSTALGLAIIVRSLIDTDDFIEQSVDLLLQIRPKARPNTHILELGLRQFLEKSAARKLMVQIANHPRLFANRFPNIKPS